MPATPDIARESLPPLALYWLMPLRFFYERRSLPMPPIRFLADRSPPEPQCSLLVQQGDMTPILTAHHGSPLRLEVLERESGQNYLLRLVNLQRQDNLRAVEFGAIGIQLSRFAPGPRCRIEAGEIPLGDILQQERIPHRGAPRGFFEIEADPLIARALEEREGAILYGRCNELSFPDGISFANVVEILPSAS